MKTRAIALVVAALASGCGSDKATGPKPPGPLDVGAILSQIAMGDLNAIPVASGSMLLRADGIPLPLIVPSLCNYSASVGGFTCPTQEVAGWFSFTISYFLYDAAGHSQSAPDANTTASVRTVIDGSGTLTSPPDSTPSSTIVLADHQDMTLSGLLTSTPILNGTGTTHSEVTQTTGTLLHATMDGKSTTSNVVLKMPGTSDPNWPISGTIMNDLTFVGTLGLTSDQQAVMTFNGTGLVTVVTSLDGKVAKTCTIDLSGQTAQSCTP